MLYCTHSQVRLPSARLGDIHTQLLLKMKCNVVPGNPLSGALLLLTHLTSPHTYQLYSSSSVPCCATHPRLLVCCCTTVPWCPSWCPSHWLRRRLPSRRRRWTSRPRPCSRGSIEDPVSPSPSPRRWSTRSRTCPSPRSYPVAVDVVIQQLFARVFLLVKNDQGETLAENK